MTDALFATMVALAACSSGTRPQPTPTPGSGESKKPATVCETLTAVVADAPTRFAKLAGAPKGDHARASTVVLPGARSCEVTHEPGQYPTWSWSCTVVIPLAPDGDSIDTFHDVTKPIEDCLAASGWRGDSRGPVNRRFANDKQPHTTISTDGDMAADAETTIQIVVQFAEPVR